jgi:hypothetical protein
MSSYFKELKSFRSDIISPSFHEFMRSMPDSIFLGTSAFALLTQNYPLGIFVVAMAEFGLFHKLISSLIGLTTDNQKPLPTDICTPGIPSPYQISSIGKLISVSVFPSGPVFFISAIIIYTLASMTNFIDEIEELGKKNPEWKIRIPLSFILSTLLLLAFVLWRYFHSCESPFILLGSVIFGCMIGYIVQLVHTYLFGRDSINFLGVPLLADRAADGKPLYVCAQQENKQV